MKSTWLIIYIATEAMCAPPRKFIPRIADMSEINKMLAPAFTQERIWDILGKVNQETVNISMEISEKTTDFARAVFARMDLEGAAVDREVGEAVEAAQMAGVAGCGSNRDIGGSWLEEGWTLSKNCLQKAATDVTEQEGMLGFEAASTNSAVLGIALAVRHCSGQSDCFVRLSKEAEIAANEIIDAAHDHLSYANTLVHDLDRTLDECLLPLNKARNSLQPYLEEWLTCAPH